MTESRRTFLRQSAAVAAASVAACAPDSSSEGGTDVSRHSNALEPGLLRALGEAVLPGELDRDGRERAVAAFELWCGGIEPVTELRHPYLVPELRYGPPDPRPGWAAQLRGLATECEKRHAAVLAEVDIATRRALIAPHIRQDGPGLGSPSEARHVAVALMAHFYASAVAQDLCYGRRIGKQQCRGLGSALDEPTAMPTAGGGP